MRRPSRTSSTALYIREVGRGRFGNWGTCLSEPGSVNVTLVKDVVAGWVRMRIHPEDSVGKVDVLAVDSGFRRRRDRPSRQARPGACSGRRSAGDRRWSWVRGWVVGVSVEFFWRGSGGIRVVLYGASDSLPPVCWPVSCACRNLRIRTRATLSYVRARAPDMRGHWVYKGENGVGVGSDPQIATESSAHHRRGRA